MKKTLLIVILIIIFLFTDSVIAYVKSDRVEESEESELRIIYISYLEYLDNFMGNSMSINKVKIEEMIDNISELKFNTIMLHVSPFSDSIYYSQIFPFSYTLTGCEGKNPGFDYLEYFIKIAHQKNIKIHAWINPYRIKSDSNKDGLSLSNPAVKLLKTSSVKVTKNGIYYNPASDIVKNLILSQIKEIIDNYDIDGIHFDDYFYSDINIDSVEYLNYINNGGTLSHEEFCLQETNDLIKKVYNLIKSKDKKIIFSISPDGNINNNYLYHFADVKTWLSDDGYIDIIMPQIYYGFENEYLPFDKALSNWKNLIKNDVKLVPILAFYKSGLVDDGSGSGRNEWLNGTDIIESQVTFMYDSNIDSFGLFRYDYLFNKNYKNGNSIQELYNLEKIL